MRLEFAVEQLNLGGELRWTACKGHTCSPIIFLKSTRFSSHSGAFLLRSQCLCIASPAQEVTIGSLLQVSEAPCTFFHKQNLIYDAVRMVYLLKRVSQVHKSHGIFTPVPTIVLGICCDKGLTFPVLKESISFRKP